MENDYFFYRNHQDMNSLLNFVSSSNLPSSFEIKFLFIVSNKNLIDSLKEWIPYKYEFEILEKGETKLTLKVTKKINKENILSGVFNIFRYENSSMYIIVTHEKQEFVKKVILDLFSYNYSDSSRLHLTSNQIQTILDSLESSLECNIITDRVISYSRIDKSKIISPGLSRRLKESDLRWTKENYQDSFKRAAENNQWVDKISFDAEKEGKYLFSASLSREGLFKCTKNIKEFYSVASKTLMNISEKNRKIFSNKSRLENKGEINPIAIKYNYSLFEEVEQNRKLISVLAELPKSSYSVYHGNPYLHASIVDYIDGSSYDIWVVSEDKIMIVPQLRSTFNSISRLCEHIFKKFQEGELIEIKL